MTVLLWILISLGAGVILTRSAFSIGRDYERTQIELTAKRKCLEASDNPFERPTMIPCPCMCKGILQFDGRNRLDTLTFLVCSSCKCCFVAGDVKQADVRAGHKGADRC